MAASGDPGLPRREEEAAVVVVGSCMTDLVRFVWGPCAGAGVREGVCSSLRRTGLCGGTVSAFGVSCRFRQPAVCPMGCRRQARGRWWCWKRLRSRPVFLTRLLSSAVSVAKSRYPKNATCLPHLAVGRTKWSKGFGPGTLFLSERL